MLNYLERRAHRYARFRLSRPSTRVKEGRYYYTLWQVADCQLLVTRVKETNSVFDTERYNSNLYFLSRAEATKTKNKILGK